MIATAKITRSVTLKAASRATGLSRDYIRKLILARSVRGKRPEDYGRWQVDMQSLLGHLRSKGFQVSEQLRTLTIVVVGTSLAWVADFSEHLPVGLNAIYAGSPFDCGRAIERDQPGLAVLDFRMGRGIAIDLGRRLLKMSIPCVGLALEDESDAPGLRRLGFSQVVRSPVAIPVVRDAVTSLVS
jgi:hypothetical protein